MSLMSLVCRCLLLLLPKTGDVCMSATERIVKVLCCHSGIIRSLLQIEISVTKLNETERARKQETSVCKQQ